MADDKPTGVTPAANSELEKALDRALNAIANQPRRKRVQATPAEVLRLFTEELEKELGQTPHEE